VVRAARISRPAVVILYINNTRHNSPRFVIPTWCHIPHSTTTWFRGFSQFTGRLFASGRSIIILNLMGSTIITDLHEVLHLHKSYPIQTILIHTFNDLVLVTFCRTKFEEKEKSHDCTIQPVRVIQRT
jgi:hypothetical protein